MKIQYFAVLVFVFFVLCSQTVFSQNAADDDEMIDLITTAVEYFNRGNQGATTIASEQFTAVLEKCREKQIKVCEAIALNYLGQISLREDKTEKALDFFNQSMALLPQIESGLPTEKLKIENLLGAGLASNRLSRSERALKYLEEAMTLSVAQNDKPKQAVILSSIGDVYESLGRREKKLEKYQQSLKLVEDEKMELPALEVGLLWEISAFRTNYDDLKYHRRIVEIHKKLGDSVNAVMTLNVMFTISAQSGNTTAAKQFCDEAVILARSVGRADIEAQLLNSLAYNYSDLGELAKAVELAEKVLPVYQNLNYITGLANIQGFLGGTYLRLGEYTKAVEKYKSSISFLRTPGCRQSEQTNAPDSYFCRKGEIAVITGMAKALNSLGRKTEAVELLEAEIKKMESDPEPITQSQEKGLLLNVIGQIYTELKDNEKAIKYYSLALPLIKNVNVRRKSTLLADTAQAQTFSGSYSEAQFSFDRSLITLTPFAENNLKGREEAVGYTLTALMLFHQSKNPKFAILLGKKAIQAYNQVRQTIRKLDKETQKVFLKSNETAYRTLAELLIEQDRANEALQVLNSFKDQQFFDFDQTQIKQIAPFSLTPRETELAARFEKSNEEIATLEMQSESLKYLIGKRQPSVDETNRLNSLTTQTKKAVDDFLIILRQVEAEFLRPGDRKDKTEVPDLRAMQAILSEVSQQTKQKTVAVYQLIGKESFHAIVVMPDSLKSVSLPVKNAELQKRAVKFWALLQSPIYDPTKLGKELYDTIFKPLENELPKDTETIMWSLDGNLRYVPMAALYDGKRYLIERFSHVNFTRADKERMTRIVRGDWTATGFGSTNAQTVELLGRKKYFPSLPGVNLELQMIIKQKSAADGIFDGEAMQDAQFTKANFLAAMKQKRPLVHISSHFSFLPGDETNSFLLLGDGSPFTLAEMKQQEMLFQGVELLTLSACNTAANQPDASGRDIDAFSELAQRLGANAVLATLWPVSDNSTPALMREFYELKLNHNQSKSEALRRAQLSLLKGTVKAKTTTVRTGSSSVEIIIRSSDEKEQKLTPVRGDHVDLDEQDAPPFSADKMKPFAHPFYWSPFVLFGNWK